ncbi:unnamed protein product, partial [Rhizoctonia solani]
MDSSTQRKLAEIDRDIKSLLSTLSQTGDGDPNQRPTLVRLANFYSQRSMLSNEPEDMSRMIEYMTAVLALTDDDYPGMSGLLGTVGMAHGRRSEILGDMDDIDKAIEFTTLSLALTPDDHPVLPFTLSNLGLFHKKRYERLGELSDVEKAIQYDSRAMELTPPDDPNLPERVGKLGSSYFCRFQRLGRLEDLEQAIEYQSTGVALAPDDYPALPSMLGNLATSHNDRFQRLNELNDIETAIMYETRALGLPLGDLQLSFRFANLGTSYSYRYQYSGEADDIDKAIEYKSRALALTPEGHSLLPTRLANIGESYISRFIRMTKLDDLEKAINYKSSALSLTPDDHPQFSHRLTELGVSHNLRFKRLGELNDIDKAIEYQTRALSLMPDTYSDLPDCLNNLAASHASRYKHLNELADIDKAIDYGSRALALIPDGHPDMLNCLANLGVFHDYRSKQLNEMDDLEKAMAYKYQVLALVPGNHQNVPGYLTNLAVSHKNRFRRLATLDDLEKAIEHESRALTLIPEDYPHLCLLHANHATSHIWYSLFTKDSSHLQAALPSFRIACTSLAGAPRDRFRYALLWTTNASELGTPDSIEAYQTIIDILPQFIWLGATTDQRYEDLKSVNTLVMNAAHAAILSSNYSLALQWLEHTRGVVWSQNLMLRSPLEDLQASHPALATQLRVLADELYIAGSEPRESQAYDFKIVASEHEDAGRRHRRLATEYAELLDQVRTLSGFEDFLRPIKSNRLVHAARTGPIVVISCRHDRCDALLVLPQQADIAYLSLPDFSAEKAKSARSELEISVENMRSSERGTQRRPMIDTDDSDKPGFERVLATLWNAVVKPILDFLGYTANVASDNLPHITWCPTGAMTFLPLHAAGDYDQPQSRVFDYVVSSYTPTLTVLLKAAPYTLRPDSRLLAVGQAATPGHAPLPGTAEELDCVKARTQG